MEHFLTLVLLNLDLPFCENTLDPDQLVSNGPIWSGSVLISIQFWGPLYCLKSHNWTDWKLEVNVDTFCIQQDKG